MSETETVLKSAQADWALGTKEADKAICLVLGKWVRDQINIQVDSLDSIDKFDKRFVEFVETGATAEMVARQMFDTIRSHIALLGGPGKTLVWRIEPEIAKYAGTTQRYDGYARFMII